MGLFFSELFVRAKKIQLGWKFHPSCKNTETKARSNYRELAKGDLDARGEFRTELTLDDLPKVHLLLLTQGIVKF